MDKDVVTTEERYSRAITSSHLRAGDAVCDADVLIAAGWLPNELGPLLYRLRVELDMVRGDQLRVQENRRELQAAIKQTTAQMQREMRHGPSRAAADLAELRRREKELDAEEVTTDARALLQLSALPTARDALGRWAEVEANRFIVRDVRPHPLKLKALRARMEQDMRNGPSLLTDELVRLEHRRQRALEHAARSTTLTPAAVCSLTAGVLQAFMSPLCRSCHGRGRTGGNGKAEAACRTCHGTGLARETLGQSDEQRAFCGHMLAEMERMFDAVNRCMQHYLRGSSLRS